MYISWFQYSVLSRSFLGVVYHMAGFLPKIICGICLLIQQNISSPPRFALLCHPVLFRHAIEGRQSSKRKAVFPLPSFLRGLRPLAGHKGTDCKGQLAPPSLVVVLLLSAESILTLKNRESIHFGSFLRGFVKKESIHDTWVKSWVDSLLYNNT